MKALLLVVVFVAAFLFVGQSEAQSYQWDGFFLGTLGVDMSDGLAFGGFTGYYSGVKNSTGLGVMGSYVIGNKAVYDYNLRLQIINVYFSATYTLGQSTFIASQGSRR